MYGPALPDVPRHETLGATPTWNVRTLAATTGLDVRAVRAPPMLFPYSAQTVANSEEGLPKTNFNAKVAVCNAPRP